MNEKELIKKIKSRGYWRVNVIPLRFEKKRITDRKELLKMVEESAVRLRGWDYPHISHWKSPQSRKPIIGEDYIEGGSDWETQIEFWRMYQSGQFIHLFALDEDWWGESGWYSSRTDLTEIKPGEALGTISAIYTATEIFEFIHRLAKLGVYDDGALVTISLENTEGRTLRIFDAMRAPLFMEYRSPQETIKYEAELTSKELLTENKKIALDAIIWIFESFQWLDVPRQVFEEDQRKLYERRM